MTTKALKKQLMAAIAMVVVAAIALTSATYAWFVNNAQVTATNVNATATTSKFIEISKTSATEDFGSTVDLNATLNAFAPVSAGTEYLKTGTFYKAQNWNTLQSETNHGVIASTFVTATKGKDYYEGDIWLKANADVSALYLDDSTTTIEAKNGSTNNANAPKALRIVFVPYTAGEGSNETVGTPIVLTPDATAATTGSYYNTNDGSNANITAAKRIASVNGTTNKATLEDDNVVAASTYTATVTSDGYTAAANSLGTLTANSAKHYKVYIYMEGCDQECVSELVNPGADLASYKINLGFYGVI